MVDNFELIENILTYQNDDEFYMLQILKRRKENPEMNIGVYPIKTVYLHRKGQLLELKNDLIALAEMYNARIYINLNVKSFKRVTCMALGAMAERIATEDYNKPYKIWESCAGKSGGCRDTRWLIDVDITEVDEELFNTVYNGSYGDMCKSPCITSCSDCSVANCKLVKHFSEKLNEYQPFGDKVVGYVPTRNGFHIITKPFDARQFNKDFPNIIIHKNNPTLVYYKGVLPKK